jgi:low temperature requirement protein LtrA
MTEPTSTGLRVRARMTARAIDEPHRVSSQLELLVDLTFVVAVSFATARLAHSLADGPGAAEIVAFLEVFFAIWWAWMNFTWFASAYDTDDVPYRLLTLVQMAGVLVLAGGVAPAATDADYRAVTIGYLIMRTGLVAQWLRAGAEAGADDRAGRATARRYAAGIAGAQVGWLAFLVLAGDATSIERLPGFVALVALELAVPRWAERTRPTSWHPHHIAERYGLFTIILLGEIVLAATTAVQRTVATSRPSAALVTVAVSALLLVFALWWLYFLDPAGRGLVERRQRSYRWGYGHFVVFSALAALGAGLDVAVEQTAGAVSASPTAVSYAVAVPVATFLLALSGVHATIAPTRTVGRWSVVNAAAVVLLLPIATPWTSAPTSIAATATVGVVLTAVSTIARRPGRSGHNDAVFPVLADIPSHERFSA